MKIIYATILSFLGCATAHAGDNASAMTYLPEQLAGLLRAHPDAPLIPELTNADVATLAKHEPGRTVLEWARKAPAEWPRTSYSLYRTFKKTGERKPYEKEYYAKRELLTRAALAVWMENDAAALDRVNDYLWSICEETTWVFPAHERPEPYYIDLFCAETGSELAQILYVLGSRLPEEVRNRVRHELETRILAPYAEHASWYSWGDGHNNWTSVCAGSIGETFLLVDTDAARQSAALAHVLEQLHNFIDRGFESDGGCLEGVSYWNYGLLHYVTFSELLRARTDGAIDLLSQPKLKAIARYPQAVALGGGAFASFADSHEEGSPNAFEIQRIAERTGETGLLAFARDEPTQWRFAVCLRNVLWHSNATQQQTIEDVYLPTSAIAKRVATASGKPAVLVAKAGHNAEPHNHNDIGSFIFRVGDDTFLCDPGAGLYSKEYFSADRYKNVFCNSYGHSVPRIGERLQQAGKQFRGEMELTPSKDLRITFDKAYNIPELTEAVRNLALNKDGVLRLEDIFRFTDAGAEVEEAFLTWLPVEIKDGAALIAGKGGILTLTAEGAVFKAELLKEACEANHVKATLTRISAVYPAKSEITARVSAVYSVK